MKDRPLSPRQLRFVAAFIVAPSARQAALQAGYSSTAAEVQAAVLLKKPRIQEAIEAARTKLIVRSEITQDRVIQELALLAFSNIEHYEVDEFGKVTVTKDAPPGAMRALSSIKRKVFTDREGNVTREVEIKLWDKPAPLRLAGKTVGLFNDRELTKEQVENEVDDRIKTLLEEAREARARKALDVKPE